MPRTDGRHGSSRDRTPVIIILAVVGVLALAGGYVLGTSGNDQASPSGSPAGGVTPTDGPSPGATQTATPEPSATEEPQTTDLEDGRHFVAVKQVIVPEQGLREIEFDLAYFLTGAAAEQAAAEHGDEVLNDYYIVNDNPRLRRVPVTDDASVSYVPEPVCCDLQPGDLDAWVDSMNEVVMSDYPDASSSWWWLTIESGQVVQIEHQWVP